MSFKPIPSDLALPPGSLILVTGASGFIASHIVTEALAAGYRVRGTARTQAKVDKTVSLFKNDKYEGVVVEDMAQPSAYHNAVKGVDAIIHTANVMTFSSDPSKVIGPSVEGALGALRAAAQEQSVKRFVVTSSSTAATMPKPGVKFRVDASTWNTEVAHLADKKGELGPDQSFPVYAASKYMGERAVWDWVEKEKPHFVVNAVLPNGNTGRILDSAGATGNWVIDTFHGKPPRGSIPPQYMIDVIDDARIHIAAAIDKTLANERILAFDTAFNWNSMIDAVAHARPDAQLPAKDPDEKQDLSEIDNKLGAQLLKKWWGQDGYKGILQSVKENLEGV